MKATKKKNLMSRHYNFDRSCEPNAGKMAESMRYTGYNNYSAIADLIDNSIDAHATMINVYVRIRNGESEIVIADNGDGMSEFVLDQAVRFGSEVEKDEKRSLGKFGMGLTTASTSIGRSFTIITQEKTRRGMAGRCITGAYDIDELIKQNRFVFHLDESSREEIRRFRENVDGDSGTVLIIEKCDNLNKNCSTFAESLSEKIGEIFRFFLMNGLEIWVNDEPVKAIDPLCWSEKGTKKEKHVLSVDLKEKGFRVVEDIQIKIAVLEEKKLDEWNTHLERDQGFYLMRNNRQIARAETLDMFVKHSELNRVRIEIGFSGDLDRFMGITFKKNEVAPNQKIRKQMEFYLKSQLAKIRFEMRKSQEAIMSEEVARSFEATEKLIGMKWNSLDLPFAEKEKKEIHEIPKPDEPQEHKEYPKDYPDVWKKPVERKEVTEPKRLDFQLQKLGFNGPMYDARVENRMVVVVWNEDHVFYKKVVAPLRNKTALSEPLRFLIFCLACTELKLLALQDRSELLSQIRAVTAKNMKNLLS